MALGAIIGGGIAALTGLIGGMTQKGPDEISTQQAKYEPDPIEEALLQKQLDIAISLKNKVNDPAVMEGILSTLPTEKMSPADRQKWKDIATQNKKEQQAQAGELQKQAVGRSLEDLVAKGALTQEQADKQKVQNDAAINSMLKIHGNKMDAWSKKTSINQFVKGASEKLTTAGMLAQINDTNQRLANKALSGVLETLGSRKSIESGLMNTISRANAETDIMTSGTRWNLGVSTLATAGNMGADLYKNYQEKKFMREIASKYGLTY